MDNGSLILVSCSVATASSDLVQHVLEVWPAPSRPQIKNLTPKQLLADEKAVRGAAVVWICVDEGDTDNLYELVGPLQERNIPTMISRPDERHPVGTPFQDGVVIGPPDASPLALCAVLRTLAAQAGLLQSLATELSILRAHQGGLCDQIDKIDTELRLAAQLQREFLPLELPVFDNLEIKVIFRPASYVSGDIYDVKRLDDKYIGMFIADAVGHGVPAALMTMYIKRSLRMKQIDPDLEGGYRIVSPDVALAQLNRDIMSHQGGRIHTATACYGLLNLETLELTIARAGHPYPLILRPDGPAEQIRPDGAMLGIFPGESFALSRHKLRPGDRVVFYSDGFEEAFADCTDGDALEYGYLRVFDDLTKGTLSEAAERLSQRLDHEAGSLNQTDDITAMLLAVPDKLDSGGASRQDWKLTSTGT
jgi:sigma-B regulation protein RsbU (phosphoserine phosphatase)